MTSYLDYDFIESNKSKDSKECILNVFIKMYFDNGFNSRDQLEMLS